MNKLKNLMRQFIAEKYCEHWFDDCKSKQDVLKACTNFEIPHRFLQFHLRNIFPKIVIDYVLEQNLIRSSK